MKRDFKFKYIVTSERGFWDETDIELYTNAEYAIGQWIVLDGIRWLIIDVENLDKKKTEGAEKII